MTFEDHENQIYNCVARTPNITFFNGWVDGWVGRKPVKDCLQQTLLDGWVDGWIDG